jgi:hypothetical protein
MDPDLSRKGLVPSRGVVLFEDFCRHTGLDPATVEDLMRSELLESSLWTKETKRPFGIFDDELPSREALAAMGLPVRDDYDPEALRTYEMPADDDDPAWRGFPNTHRAPM